MNPKKYFINQLMRESLNLDLKTLTKREVLEKYDLGFLENPSFGGWSIERDLCQFIGKFCETYRPSRVLEFGTGLSTLILANEVSKQHVGEVFSIDHIKDFQNQTKTTLEKRFQNHLVHFHHFPLSLTYEGGKLFYFYKVSHDFLSKNGPFDLVLVDGPPGFYKSREAALYKIYPYLSREALIVLDDAKRNLEQTCLENWKWYFGNSIQDVLQYPHFKKGLACVSFNSSLSRGRSFSLKERFHSSLKGIRFTLLRSLRRTNS